MTAFAGVAGAAPGGMPGLSAPQAHKRGVRAVEQQLMEDAVV